jgi:IS1 family transposase
MMLSPCSTLILIDSSNTLFGTKKYTIAATDGSAGKVLHKISKLIQAYRTSQCYTDFWKSNQEVIRRASNTQRSAKKQEKPRVLECWNNTLRQRLARFVRKTLSFSQSLFMQNVCLNLFLHRYNIERAAILL